VPVTCGGHGNTCSVQQTTESDVVEVLLLIRGPCDPLRLCWMIILAFSETYPHFLARIVPHPALRTRFTPFCLFPYAAAGAEWINVDQQGELSERSEFSPCRCSSFRRREMNNGDTIVLCPHYSSRHRVAFFCLLFLAKQEK
jgi:hypothetical protein